MLLEGGHRSRRRFTPASIAMGAVVILTILGVVFVVALR